MLVLSRKTGERIHIGNDIFIEVRRVAGNRTTLAICAPKNVRILRGELKESAAAFEKPTSADEPASKGNAEAYLIASRRVDPAESFFYSI